jgi:hypothetical protein
MKTVLTIGLTLMVAAANAFACAMFTVTDGDRVLFANNEDYIKPGYIWFVPGKNGRYGRVNVGFSEGFAQGSLNEAGLCFDAAALPKVPYEEDPDKKTPRNLIEKIMDECATVEEAIAYFGRYNCPHLAHSQFMFADKSGDAAVITWDPRGFLSVVLREGPYQLITNDRLENSSYRCPRFVLAERALLASAEPSLENVRDVLKTIHQRGEGAFTSYSTIYDLNACQVFVYNLANFDEVVSLDLNVELEKGKRSMPMADLFKNSPNLASIQGDAPRSFDTRIEIAPALMREYAGPYRFEADGQAFPMSVVMRQGGLVLRRDGQRDAVMYPESETTFRLVDGGQISFERDETGQVSAMVLHRNGDHRAKRIRAITNSVAPPR